MQKDSILAYIKYIAFFAIMFSLVEAFFFRFMPLSYRAEYTSVSPVQEVYNLSEKPSFNFTRVVRHEVKIDGRNSLDCYLGDGERYVTYFNGYGKIKPNTESKPRPYLHEGPDVPSTCIFKSDLYLVFSYGITRHLAELQTVVKFE